MPQVYLTDGHINLVLQDESMAEVMVTWMNDKEVTAYLARGHWPMTLAFETEYLKKRYQETDQLTLGIEIKESKRLIGCIGLHKINYINQNCVLGIAIGEKDCWGQGYGQRAINLALQHAFMRLNLRNVILNVLGNNPRGKSCYEKCGFVESGRFPEYIYKDGVWHDEIFMQKTRN